MQVEHGMASRSKGQREGNLAQDRLRFDVRIRNVNKQIGECDNEVELGCLHVSWEGVEMMSETIPQQKGSAPHRKQDPETRIGPISRQACVQQQLSVEGH